MINNYLVNVGDKSHYIKADGLYLNEHGYVVFHTDGLIVACFKHFDSFHAYDESEIKPFPFKRVD